MERELLIFLKLFLSGIFLTVLYDSLKIWRNVIFHSRFWIDLEDLIYWSGTGLFLFGVIYVENNGQIRVYAMIGAIAGALLYHMTISRWIVKSLSLLLSKIVVLFGILLTPLHWARKRLKLYIKRVKLFLYEQKSIQKVRKNQNEKERKSKIQSKTEKKIREKRK